ncbi:MAG: alpha/beta hydrolase fold domain-containing protein [Phenylobacterium sp.]|nr:alpha/beta hydrolase fold domain-containing protein [Phenylobacterium sp.]MDP3853830.1 alpha/beta hydrolase fold domain-containing protein [Phenylobacterium sp.]
MSYGIYDLSMSPSQRLRRDQRLGLSTPHLEWMIEQFTPSLSPEDRRRPEVSPLFAHLGGLPPALFIVGSADILLDDTLFLAARWASCGNAADLEVHPEAPHGFNALPTAIAMAANRRIEAFLAAHCAVDAPGPAT